MSSGPAVVALDLADPPGSWSDVGLTVADGVAQVGATTLRFGSPTRDEGEQPATGLVGWALEGVLEHDVDGLPTQWLPRPVQPNHPVDHPLGVTAVDHVVVATPDLARTVAAFEAAGMTLRREGGRGEHRQAFFRHGECIVEVVGPQEPSGAGPATFWGLTLVVADLDAAVAQLGPERCGAPRDAVQPGRRIAALTREAGLGTRVALMTRG